jgi:hypothetical protein
MARRASKRSLSPAIKRRPVQKAPRKKAVLKKITGKQATPVRKAPGKTRSAANSAPLDLNGFPPESLIRHTRGLCLACALDVLTRHMGLNAERAQSEIRRNSPSYEELSSDAPPRPYIPWPAEVCPYCGAPSKWHAPLHIVRIEGGKTTDAPRRALIRKIEKSPTFTVIEEKSTERDALYDWLAKTGASLDLDSPGWLLEAARHWLGRRLPKEDWTEIFKQTRFVRRSRRLQDGFQLEAPGLFLAPALFDEVLLIQYLLSRSSKAGGQTFEGRMTLQDLFHRLRGGGYLRTMGIMSRSPAEALEQLVEVFGGEGRVKFYYIVDRRDLFARLAGLKAARLPRPRR